VLRRQSTLSRFRRVSLRGKMQNRLMITAFGVVAAQAACALVFKQSYTLTVLGDAFSCVLALIALLACCSNVGSVSGVVRSFWMLTASSLAVLLASQVFWEYYDFRRLHSVPSPVPGDTLFLLVPLPVLAALALRPHAVQATQILRFRRLDFLLLVIWWLWLFGYFALPWQYIVIDFSKYNPVDYSLTLVEHCAVIFVLVFLRQRTVGDWKKCYSHLLSAFVLFAAGNLLQSIAINGQMYYAGSLFDTPWCLSLAWFTVAAKAGRELRASASVAEPAVTSQGLWTARLAMLAMVSLPALAIWSYLDSKTPPAVIIFRLRLTLSAMLVLGSLVFLKIHLLDHELVRLVRLTERAVENLKRVQTRISQSQKMAALGRLAAGAAHEISNPLTAILGYSELLAENPALTPPERQCAAGIQEQVRRAQAAVDSMRNLTRPAAVDDLAASKK
jgi:signal transduction histidine kinase